MVVTHQDNHLIRGDSKTSPTLSGERKSRLVMYKGYVYRHWIINDKGIEKSYIGQVYNRTPEQRWGTNGRGYLNNGSGKEIKTKFANAIHKYGWDNFQHKVLFVIECETLEELIFWLNQWEMYFIEKYDSFKNGYNMTLGGEGVRGSSYERTDKIKNKTSKTWKRKYEEGYINNFKGKKHTKEARRKNSEANSGSKHHRYGKHLDDDVKQKISNTESIAIICLDTLQIFKNAKECGEWCGVGRRAINNCVCGRSKTSGKHPETGENLHWMFYKDYLKLQNELN